MNMEFLYTGNYALPKFNFCLLRKHHQGETVKILTQKPQRKQSALCQRAQLKKEEDGISIL